MAGRSHRVVAAVTAATMAVLLIPGAAARAKPRFDHLDPGGKAQLRERVPVNFVFLGYERSDIDTAKFRSWLPAAYTPIERFPYFYDIKRDLGIRYTYDYDLVFTDRRYEDRFFSALTKLGVDRPLTSYQVSYNNQQSNVLDIDSNLEIDAPTVEKWLAANPPAGVTTTENTLFFINWYGRPDFRFHVYGKTGELGTDTGLDEGKEDLAKLIAWGGTTPDDPESGLGRLARVWFYDLSAGPEWNTGNWRVDTTSSSYWMPPIWEYSKNGYRDPSALTLDLARIARYVGINLLFTSSPLYAPAITSPDLPGSVNLDLNYYEGDPRTDSSKLYTRPKAVVRAVEDLLPHTSVTADRQDLPFEDPGHLNCFAQWYPSVGGVPPCYPERTFTYNAWANLYLFHAQNLGETYDDPKADYEVGAFNYFLPESAWGCFAYADDNYVDGTQSFVYFFLTRACTSVWGYTDVLIHEFGHHFGMSHTHDGFDSAEDDDYGPGGDKYFIWIGDESNSVMSYFDFNNEFGQFDRDNLNRWMAAAYITAANSILGTLLAESDVDRVRGLLSDADQAVGRAGRAFSGHQYLSAVTLAKRAYDLMRSAARRLGVEVVGSGSGADLYEGRRGATGAGAPGAYSFVDPIGVPGGIGAPGGLGDSKDASFGDVVPPFLRRSGI